MAKWDLDIKKKMYDMETNDIILEYNALVSYDREFVCPKCLKVYRSMSKTLPGYCKKHFVSCKPFDDGIYRVDNNTSDLIGIVKNLSSFSKAYQELDFRLIDVPSKVHLTFVCIRNQRVAG